MSSELADDFLSRASFLTALHRHVDDIASIPLDHLPAPRVLAVDAPWGSGKSWIARRFKEQLTSEFEGRPVAFIDAFRYDHHSDVFAVIASAVLAALKPHGAKKKRFLEAAAELMTIAAPVVARVAVNAIAGKLSLEPGAIADAVDSAKKAVGDNAGKLTEKSLEKLLDGYARTQQLQEDFEGSLGAMTADLDQPFVIIIDELDRCRPSFALEVLERIKHLFSADKVVFVLFWNSASIHESIRHTYGRNTHAESYLAKFVSLTIQLDLPTNGQLGPERAYAGFINLEMARVLGNILEREEFKDALSTFAAAFNASLRDVQRAISILRILITFRIHWRATELAYLLVLDLTHPTLSRGVMKSDRQALEAALALLPYPDPELRVDPIRRIWVSLRYRLDPSKYQELVARGETGASEADDLVVAELKRNGSYPTWIDETAKALRIALATGRAN